MRSNSVRVLSALVCVTVVAGLSVVAAGQQSPVTPVYTAEQAKEGRSLFAINCARCHMPDLSGNVEIPALAGPMFTGTWGTRSTKDLFDYVSAAMPYGGPSLDAKSYTLIIAYILQVNGAVAGTEALTASTAAPILQVTTLPKTR
jgi:mono/diheme cytochrome c family protein